MAEDIVQMQRQAAQRVGRMREHSRRIAEEHGGQFPAPNVPPRSAQAAGYHQPALRSPGLYARYTPPAPTTVAETVCEPREQLKPSCEKPAKSALSFDGEQWLLLGLALLLFRSGCRPELAIALLYLAL